MKTNPAQTSDLQQYQQEPLLKLSQMVPGETQLSKQDKAEIPAQFDGLIACILIEHKMTLNENKEDPRF